MAERCRRCKREIRWATTPRGKRIRLDDAPSDVGEFRVTYEAARVKNGEVIPATWWAEFVPAEYRDAARRQTGLHAFHDDVCDPITPEDLATADTEQGVPAHESADPGPAARLAASVAG